MCLGLHRAEKGRSAVKSWAGALLKFTTVVLFRCPVLDIDGDTL